MHLLTDAVTDSSQKSSKSEDRDSGSSQSPVNLVVFKSCFVVLHVIYLLIYMMYTVN